MPFWTTPEWEKYPDDPATYPIGCQEFVREYRTMWEKEAAQLASLNIPVPQMLRNFTTNYGEETTRNQSDKRKLRGGILTITPPQFLIPPNVIFKVIPKRNPFNEHNFSVELECAFVSFDTYDQAAAMTDELQALIEAKDIVSILERFSVRFFNRDPYVCYRETSKPIIEKNYEYVGSVPPWQKKAAKLPIPPPLETVPWFSSEVLDNVQTRFWLYQAWSGKEMNARFIGAALMPPENYPYSRVSLPPYFFDSVPIPPHYEDHPTPVNLKILPDLTVSPRLAEQFIGQLHQLKYPLHFAVIAERGTVYFKLSCAPDDRPEIERQLAVHFPGFVVLEHEAAPDNRPRHRLTAAPSQAHLSLKTLREFSIDPYTQLFPLYGRLGANDYAELRIRILPIPNEMVQSVCSLLRDMDAFEEGIKKKRPLWLTGLLFESTSKAALDELQSGFLKIYETTQVRWIIREGFPHNCYSAAELAGLIHFPDRSTPCEGLETAAMKAKLPPDLYTQEGVIIGHSTARGQTKTVTIPDSVRDRHVYVVGKSGTGKSTLLFNAIRQDIESGAGVAVIDPHGDLVEEVLHYIPEDRIEDTIYFNAADKDHPIGLNILNAQDEDEIGLLADDLLITFKRLSESWGERMENILRYTIHTLLRTEDSTFLDIKTLLQNPDYRQQVAAQTNNRMLRDFWQLEYPSYPKDAAQPILNRMSKFSLSPVLAGILGQPDSTLNFFDVIQNRKILLVSISKGQIGEDTAQLLGSVIVSQLQLAIMRRAAMPKESREPYYLYVDEFQNFTTSAFEKILSEARKYKLCLTLAHQYISQLDERTKNAILANVGTIVMFQSYPADAQALRPELGQYESTDVTNLNTASHEALCKPSTQSKDTFMFQTLAPPPRPESHVREIIEYTRENYATTPYEYDAPKIVPSPTPQTAPHEAIHYPTRPARALPKEFANTGDKILHYVTQAEWLATPQIHDLVYSHVSETARASNASRDLKALVEAKRIKFQNFGKNKIYYTTRQVNPTTHNLAIRDLFAKILASGYELAEVNFFPQLPGLTPDLAVSFLNEDGTQTKTFWEYDAGTEGIAELLKKVSRYDTLARDALVVFVFNSRERLHQFAKAAGATRIVGAVINELTTLDDGVFVFLQGGETASEASGLFR